MSGKKNSRKFSEEFKLSVLRDYYSTGMSQHACARKYAVTQSMIYDWLKQYNEKIKSVSLSSSEELEESGMSNRSTESYREENEQLKKRIKELEKALSISRLETESRDLLITRAEEYYKLPIRKKSGAK